MTDTQGHNTPDELKKDAFAASDADYQQVMAEALSEDTEGAEPSAAAPDDQPAPTTDRDDTGPPEADIPESFIPQPTQPQRQEPNPLEAQANDMVELIHHGQVHTVTRQKAVELAQKGFDYDSKVGPHARIVQLIESDPGAARALNDYVTRRSTPDDPLDQRNKPQELKGLSGFDSENDWFKENYNRMQQQAPPPTPPTADPRQAQVQSITNVLAARDPQGYPTVSREMDKYAKQYLTVNEYQAIEGGDMSTIVNFYDWVRGQIIPQNAGPPPGRQTAPTAREPAAPPPSSPPRGNPQFRMKSQGGQPERGDNSYKKVWELPNDKFQEVISKARGY